MDFPKIPPYRPATPEEIGAIRQILPEHDEGWSDDDLESHGYAYLRDVGDIDGHQAMIEIDLTSMNADAQTCMLIPIQEQDVCLRLYWIDQNEGHERMRHLEVFVHDLADLKKIREAVLHKLAVKTLNYLIGSLNDHGTPEENLARLRLAMQSSEIGGVFKADEAARALRASIDGEGASSAPSQARISRPGP